MDGFEATKRIRNQAHLATLPVIALTAGVTQEEHKKCLASGMNGFIAKPINPQQLLLMLAQWVKPIGLAATDSHTIGCIEGQAVMEALPGFDMQNLLTMLGHDQQLAVRLLLAFMESMKNLPDQIKAGLTAGDLAAAKELVHKIKGASGNIGAIRLHAASEALETELKEGCFAATFSTFEAAFDQTMSVIATLDQPEEPLPSNIGDIEALKPIAAELDQLLKENDFIPETLLNSFKGHLALGQLDLFVKLHKHINDLRYDEARKILRQFAGLPAIQETL
jgi:HPt (histidine-containing phosphotransfer) domain-containing protein